MTITEAAVTLLSTALELNCEVPRAPKKLIQRHAVLFGAVEDISNQLYNPTNRLDLNSFYILYSGTAE